VVVVAGTVAALPERVAVVGGEIVPEASAKWPELLLGVFRISLVDSAAGGFYPLRREWVNVERAATPATRPAAAGVEGEKGKAEVGGAEAAGGRWRLLGDTTWEAVYENTRALPRAWLASEARAMGEEATLKVIRTGSLPDGSTWEPMRTALVEQGAAAPVGGARGGDAQIVRYEPNRVDVRTKADAPSVLVLGENHYPGWRAYLGGRSVGVLRVNYGLRGVPVPAGEHEVRSGDRFSLGEPDGSRSDRANALSAALGRYRSAREWVWVQEESQNMGGWAFVAPRLRDLTGGFGPDVVIDAVGRPETYKQAFAARDLAGTVVLVGVPTPQMTLEMPLIEFFGHGGALKSSWYGDCLPSRDFPLLIELSLQGRLPLDDFVTERIGLGDVEEAFHRMERGEVLRSVVVMDEAQ